MFDPMIAIKTYIALQTMRDSAASDVDRHKGFKLEIVKLVGRELTAELEVHRQMMIDNKLFVQPIRDGKFTYTYLGQRDTYTMPAEELRLYIGMETERLERKFEEMARAALA